MLKTSCDGASKRIAKAAVIATAKKTEIVKPKSANKPRTSTSKTPEGSNVVSTGSGAGHRDWMLGSERSNSAPTDAKRPVGVISLIGDYGGTPSQKCSPILARN